MYIASESVNYIPGRSVTRWYLCKCGVCLLTSVMICDHEAGRCLVREPDYWCKCVFTALSQHQSVYMTSPAYSLYRAHFSNIATLWSPSWSLEINVVLIYLSVKSVFRCRFSQCNTCVIHIHIIHKILANYSLYRSKSQVLIFHSYIVSHSQWIYSSNVFIDPKRSGSALFTLLYSCDPSVHCDGNLCGQFDSFQRSGDDKNMLPWR